MQIQQAQTTQAPSASDKVPIDLARNRLAFGGDALFWGIGSAFIPLSTVITALAAALTHDKVLIGLISPAWFVANLLPQIVAARLVHGKRQTKPHMVISALIGRQALFLMAMWLFITRARQPTLTVWVLISVIAITMGLDAITGQAWFDIIGRVFSSKTKVRVLTFNLFLSAVGGIGAGVMVARVLTSSRLSFPSNYAVLFGLAWVFVMLSTISLMFVRERKSDAPLVNGADSPGALSFSKKLRDSWRNVPTFRLVLLIRLLAGAENMAGAFYIVFAQEQLELPDTAIGAFTVALTLGSLVGIVLFGWLAERFGSQRVIRVACTLQCLAPLAAALVTVLPSHAPQLSYAILIVVMAINGAVSRSAYVGFLTYAQDSAPDGDRPVYVGALSTAGGIASLLPILGGVLLDLFTHSGWGRLGYLAVFGLAASLAGLGSVVSFRLPKARPAFTTSDG